MEPASIKIFFEASSREENDAANKVRESILKVVHDPPANCLSHPEFGALWKRVNEAWMGVLHEVATRTSVSPYTSIKVTMRGGRKYNYDADVYYLNGSQVVGQQKIEFKYGGTSIGALPQFLSLQAKFQLFENTYDRFWYELYLPKYLDCDPGITESKPTLDTYLSQVTKVKSNHSFFVQLKEREKFFKDEKNRIVNESITAYLNRFGSSINIPVFTEKVQTSQQGKIYLLWSEGKFHIDSLKDDEMREFAFDSVRNGNILQVKAGTAMYCLLLRWRNHKGILNPAWQIGLKRI